MTINVSGQLDISTGSVAEHIGLLTGTGSVNLGAFTLQLGDIGNATFDGFISGTGAILKVGNGSQTFTKNNTYTGTKLPQRGDVGDQRHANGQCERCFDRNVGRSR